MSSKPTGLDWRALTEGYIAAGGEVDPSVWHPDRRPARPAVDRSGIGGRPPREADRTDERIRARYDEGASLPELVREYQMPKTSLRNAIIRAGGTLRSRKEASRLAKSVKLTTDQEAELHRRYDAGEASTDLAKVFGLASRTVLRIVVERGGAIRNHSEAQKLNLANRNKSTEEI